MDNLKKADNTLTDKQIVIALSGGMDSVVLLHWLCEHYPKTAISAVHINHQLSANADNWQLFCQQLAAAFGVRFSAFTIQVSKSNIEADARKKRYQILRQHLPNDAYLCTAHHQQDQAETVLLQLLRGAGPAGLAAMPKAKKMAKGIHYRPLLTVSKRAIEHYANIHKLNWIDDDSNHNVAFRRNFIRHRILPLLTEHYPNVIQTLTRSASHQSETTQLLDELAQIDIKTKHLMSSNARLTISALLALNPQRQKNVLRYHLKILNFKQPSKKIINEVINNVLYAKQDATPLVSWSCYQIRRFKNELYCIDTNAAYPLPQPIKKGIEVRYRQGGERCRLSHSRHHKSLKKILQEHNIPPWQRDKLALYYKNNTLIAIEGIGEVDAAPTLQPNTKSAT